VYIDECCVLRAALLRCCTLLLQGHAGATVVVMLSFEQEER
jgi:hypothetical protein